MKVVLVVLAFVCGAAVLGAVHGWLVVRRRERRAERAMPPELRMLRALCGALDLMDRVNDERPRWSYNTDADRDVLAVRLHQLRDQLRVLFSLLDQVHAGSDQRGTLQPLTSALRDEEARLTGWCAAIDDLRRWVRTSRRHEPSEQAQPEGTWTTLQVAEESLRGIHRTHEQVIVAALIDLYRPAALHQWELHLRGTTGHVYHGTSHLFLAAIQKHGLSKIAVPAELRAAADDVCAVLRRVGMNPTGERSDLGPFEERHLSVTWRDDLVSAAAAPGLPAFAYELLCATYMTRRQPELLSIVTPNEASRLRSGWEVGAAFRRRSQILRLRLRVDEAFFRAMGRAGVLVDPEVYVDAVLRPLIARDVHRAPSLAMPQTLAECMIAFDQLRCTRTEARIRAVIPPEFIEVALPDGGWLDVRDWHDGIAIALIAPPPDLASG